VLGTFHFPSSITKDARTYASLADGKCTDEKRKEITTYVSKS